MINKRDIVKEILKHKSRVSIKLSSISNDLAARGRRHDISYTYITELNLLEKISNETNSDDKARNIKVLNGIHANNNDYIPEFHENGISDMNMLQLLEFIADKIARYEILIINKDKPKDLDSYFNFVTSGLILSDDLASVFKETIMYFINKNESIRKSLPRSSNDIVIKELDKIEGENNVKDKEE